MSSPSTSLTSTPRPRPYPLPSFSSARCFFRACRSPVCPPRLPFRCGFNRRLLPPPPSAVPLFPASTPPVLPALSGSVPNAPPVARVVSLATIAARAAGLTADCPAAAPSALRRPHICVDTPSLHTVALTHSAPCWPRVCAHTVSFPTAVPAHTSPSCPSATVACRATVAARATGVATDGPAVAV